MAYPQLFAGQRLTAALLTAMQPIVVRQSADQNITSSTTLVDTEITTTLESDAVYVGYLAAVYSADGAADIKFAWTAPSGTTINRKNILLDDGASAGPSTAASVNMRQRSAGTEQEVGGTGGTEFNSYFEFLDIITGGTAGAATLQAAQNASSATASIVRNRTQLILWRVA